MNPPSAVWSNAPYALSAQGTYADTSTSDVTNQTVWKGDSVARVSSAGTVYCNTAGKSTITATVGSYTSSVKLQCFMKQITGAPGFVEHAVTFHGPFTSWLNAKSDFGAVGDGVADDTQALQSAISAAISQFKTLWIPAGVYSISGTLHVLGSDGISIIGEDPRSTHIVWHGAINQTMISYDGSAHFRTSRIWWDCNNKQAAVGIHIGSSLKNGQLYPTYDAIEDSKISQCGTGINPEYAGETTVNRVHFDQNTYGANLGNWNAQNFNVVDSLFTDNAVGMSNYASAGAYNVSNCVFERSTTRDMEMGNTLAFSLRHNLSVGSNQFFYAGPINSGAAVTLEGNVVVDTADVPIVYGNQGTVTLLDNTFEMPSHPKRPLFVAADWKTAFVSAIGNTYTTTTPYQAQEGSFINVTSLDEAPQVTVSAGNWPIPTEVYIPPASTSPVIEVAAGSTREDVQNAVNNAARIPGGATVHLPASSYYFNTTLDIPDAPGLAIVGDGQNTDLRPGPMLLGPVVRTHGSVEMDGLFISSTPFDSSLEVLVNDQPSTSILYDLCTTVSTKQSMLVSGLDDATINTRATTLNGDLGVTLTGGFNQASGKRTMGHMDAFMTVSDTYNIAGGGHFLISDGWHDGGQSPVQAIVSGNAEVTHEGGTIAVASQTGVQAAGLTGTLSMVGNRIMTTVVADAGSTGTIGMIGSITGGTPTQLSAGGSSLKVVHGGDTIDTPVGVALVVNTPDAAVDIERALSQSRTEFAVPRKPLMTPATLVRMHRVMTGDGAVGMRLSSNGVTAASGTYSIAAPSGSNVSASCSSGTLSIDGYWSLVPGNDGFYGLLRGGVYLTDTIGTTTSTGKLETVASMMDAGQRWLMQPTGDGLFRLVNRADGSFLTRTASGCATMSTANGDLSQEWTVTTK